MIKTIIVSDIAGNILLEHQIRISPLANNNTIKKLTEDAQQEAINKYRALNPDDDRPLMVQEYADYMRDNKPF